MKNYLLAYDPHISQKINYLQSKYKMKMAYANQMTTFLIKLIQNKETLILQNFQNYYSSSHRGWHHVYLTILTGKNLIQYKNSLKCLLGCFLSFLNFTQSLEKLDVFNILILKQVFWKAKTILRKLEYRILVESATI